MCFQYIQYGTSVHGTFHNTTGTYRISYLIDGYICIIECFFQLRKQWIVCSHTKAVESKVKCKLCNFSVWKFYNK